jgi:adenine-specific DNA-methyltransferase
MVAKDLLTESGSCFVQIGDENVHLVRALMDEVFGSENFCAQILFLKTTGKGELFHRLLGRSSSVVRQRRRRDQGAAHLSTQEAIDAR